MCLFHTGHARRAATATLLALLSAPPAGMSQTALGPTPYQSFSADSPFAGLPFEYFHLEDFEDGALNAPGVSTTPSAAGVLGAGGRYFNPATTDSVDEDTGAIDGTGNDAHSYFAGNANVDTFDFSFDASVLGELPTHAGIVWSDVGFSTNLLGDGFGNVVFEAFDGANASLGTVLGSDLGDGQSTGGTAEDRFFGFVHSGGIGSIRISMTDSADWEVDHLQYGLVPLPPALLLMLGGIVALGVRARRR